VARLAQRRTQALEVGVTVDQDCDRVVPAGRRAAGKPASFVGPPGLDLASASLFAYRFIKRSPMTAMNKRVDDWSNEAAEVSLSEYRQTIKARHGSSVADLKAMVAIAQSVCRVSTCRDNLEAAWPFLEMLERRFHRPQVSQRRAAVQMSHRLIIVKPGEQSVERPTESRANDAVRCRTCQRGCCILAPTDAISF
jgi:hypothetical protein